VFEYLSKYTFTARGTSSFIAGEGKLSKIDCRGHEKGGPTMPMEKRPAVSCKVTEVSPEKSSGTPGGAGGAAPPPAATTPAPPAGGAATPSPAPGPSAPPVAPGK